MKKILLSLLFLCSALYVLSQNEPDFSVRFIKRLPEINYVENSSNPTVDGWPSAGQSIQWRAHVKNWSANSYTNVSYSWKKNGSIVKTGLLNFLPYSDVTATLDETWAFKRDSLLFTIDDQNTIAETSEANNQLLIYTDAISVNFYVEQTLYNYFHTYQKDLGLQTNSWDDWAQILNVKRWNLLFQNAVFPGTPNGVIDRLRVDSIAIVPDKSLPLAGGLATNNPNNNDRTVDLVWGFPASEERMNSYANHTSVSNGNPFYYEGSALHELGHARYLVDLYAFDISQRQVRINEGATPIAGSPLMPFQAFDVVYYNKWKSFMSGNDDYSTISVYETLALNRIAHRRAICGNYNSPCNIGVFINDLPANNTLQITDENNNVLSNACIEIYQAVSGTDWYGKDFDDVPDLRFSTNDNGEVNIGRNPFSNFYLTSGYGYSNMDVIMRVEKNNKVGYTVIEAASFNVEYWKGNVTNANYEVKVKMLNCSDYSATDCTCKAVQPLLNYKYYEGSWTTLPDFNTLTPVKTGTSTSVDISVRTPGRNDNFAFVWQGYLKITTPGTYTFETVSDDGSKLYFNSLYDPSATATVNNDGLHAATPVTGVVTIANAGVYPISITYFEKDGGEQMQAYWTGPGIARQLIPGTAFTEAPVEVSNGLAYKYYEGTWNTLPDFTALTPVKTGNSDNIDIGVRTAGRNDNFAFVWQGYINIPVAGNYTFETISDDGSKVYFNSLYNGSFTATVNNDGLHAPVSATGIVNVPAPGSYPFSVTYFEKDGGEQMQLYWTGPGITRQLIPNSAFVQTPPANSNGLTYKYYEGTWNALPDFNTLVPVKTGNSDNVDLNVRTAGRNDNFALLWQGYIKMPTAGSYIFETVSDDGSRLYFNSLYNPSATATVNNDGLHAPLSATGAVSIPSAGTYPLSITFFEKDGGEQMQVYWTGPGITRQLIPASAFTQTPPVAPDGLAYKYYEGTWSMLPDFNMLTPVKTGSTANIDLGVRTPGRNDNFAFVWQGYIKIPMAGNYTFETVSDDGSKFYFNSLYNPSAIATVNNEGVHAPLSASGTVNIAAAGLYPISITYFEKDGGEQMQLYWTGPGLTRQLVPNTAFTQTLQNSVAISSAITNISSASPDAVKVSNLTVTSVYPNPFNNSFNIDFYNSTSGNNIYVEMYDLKGRLIYSLHQGLVAKGNNSLKVSLDRHFFPAGIYMIGVKINGHSSKMVKLVKIKD